MQVPTITRLPKSLALLAAGALLLAACDSNGTVTKGISSLGLDFLRAFNQAPNDEPLDASDLDLKLTPAIEPFDP